MENTIKLISTENDSDLYYRYNTQTKRQNASLVLDLEERTLKAEVDYNIGNSISGRAYHGIDLEWTIPALKVNSLKELMEEVKDLCIQILNDSKVEHDGSNWRGYLGVDAEQARDQVEFIIEDYQGEEYQVWDAADWLCEDNTFVERIGLTAKTTDEEIEKLVERVEEEAKEEGVAVEDVESYLVTLRDNLRDDEE